jgi:hypothetical protein
MNEVLKTIKDVRGEGCVTIVMNTHRTHPDNEKDSLTLKNLVKETEERLHQSFDKRFVWSVMENLQVVVDHIDHRQNLESLLIFVNQHMAEYTRLPVPVVNRVVIDDTFATRDLVRAMHQDSGYYVLALSRQQARLIEAFNDKVVCDSCGAFPLTNPLYTTSRQDLSTNKGTDNLIEEFFNRVDKIVMEQIKTHPLPLILATETRNFDYYKKVADKKQIIVGHINKNRDEEKAHHIVSEAWEVMKGLMRDRQVVALNHLHGAVKSGKLTTDIHEIWRAIHEGRGDTLYVRKGYFQPARLQGGSLELIAEIGKERNGLVDDVIDEMIEINMAYGGNTVFVDEDLPAGNGKLALIQRY